MLAKTKKKTYIEKERRKRKYLTKQFNESHDFEPVRQTDWTTKSHTKLTKLFLLANRRRRRIKYLLLGSEQPRSTQIAHEARHLSFVFESICKRNRRREK